MLDLVAGGGRHSRLLRDSGFRVRVVDRDVSALLPLADGRCEVRQIELEVDAPWPLGNWYDGIVVTNYVRRSLLPAIAKAIAPGGGALI